MLATIACWHSSLSDDASQATVRMVIGLSKSKVMSFRRRHESRCRSLCQNIDDLLAQLFYRESGRLDPPFNAINVIVEVVASYHRVFYFVDGLADDVELYI